MARKIRRMMDEADTVGKIVQRPLLALFLKAAGGRDVLATGIKTFRWNWKCTDNMKRARPFPGFGLEHTKKPRLTEDSQLHG